MKRFLPSLPLSLISAAVFTAILSAEVYGAVPSQWGHLTLVEEIRCGDSISDSARFARFPAEGAEQTETLCGQVCRVLKPSDTTPQYMAWKVGKGLKLQPGKAYVLCVEFPEDVSRSFFIHNGGNETVNGVATGTTTGDVLMGRYVNHNPESLSYPLSGKMQTWSGLFWLHDRFSSLQRSRGVGERPLTPEDGFWVIISQAYDYLDPTSAGAAVASIKLYSVDDESKLTAKINYPPEDLPKRRLFWREEMADGVVTLSNKYQERTPQYRGVENIPDWYEFKMRWAKAMGINVFCKDLLEFGHNQGWNSEAYGGNDWIYQPHNKDLWDELVALAAEYDMPILPYYEYCGSIGGNKDLALGTQKRAKRLSGGDKYTHIWWSERANVDVADPDTVKDFQKILDCTVLKYKSGVKTKSGKTVVPQFLGAWLRCRPSANPISFNDNNLKEFAQNANGGKAVTREELKADKELRQKYYIWSFGKRAEYIEAVAKYLREKNDSRSFVLYTPDSTEPGWSFPAMLAGEGKKDAWKYKTVVVNDNPEYWNTKVQDERYAKRYVKQLPLSDILDRHLYPKSLLSWQQDWGGYEVAHSTPPAYPEGLKESSDAMFSYTFNRFYSADEDMNLFRTRAGLTAVRHFPLNENELNVDINGKPFEPTGYFVADVERAGAFCTVAEVAAVAKGDPTQIGYLTGNTFQHGFPDVYRAFTQAYLALPALPSDLVQKEKYAQEWIRKIDAGKGRIWFAVCNLAFEKTTVQADDLPAGKLQDCVSGEIIPIINGCAKIESAPMSLRSFKWVK